MSETATSAIHTMVDPQHRRTSGVARILTRMRRQPTTVLAFLFIFGLLVLAIAAPLIAPYDPTQSNFDRANEAPSTDFWLGTDGFGRDQLSRLIFGTQVLLQVAVGAVVVAALIGVPIGLLLGFNGGWWDRLGMRFVDMAQALPGMVIGLTVVSVFGRNIFVLMVAIGLIFASIYARLVRAVVLVERNKQYVEAATVGGLRTSQIIFGQVLPNLIGPIVTQGAVFLGSAIMIESAMSFLGIGLDTDIPTWGAMLSYALENQAVAPYLTWPPGIAIVLTVLAFNVFGDGLNDALTGERRKLPKRKPAGTDAAETHSSSDAKGAESALLDAQGITVALAKPNGKRVDLISDVSLRVAKGEVVGLLGESGSGKSTFARAVLGMLPPGTWLADGTVRLDGKTIDYRSQKALRDLRGHRIGAVFQDPSAALSPVHRIGEQLIEPLQIHKGMTKKAARTRAIELLDRVGVKDPASRIDDYPHEFSGGMAQRVAIAMALAADPDLLIADEATSALDVTTQAQVLDLLLDLRDEYGMGVLMITHSLGVVAETCDRAAVMYRGNLVEDAPVARLFDAPEHPYTRALLAANPMAAQHGQPLPTLDAETRAEIDQVIEIERAEVRS